MTRSKLRRGPAAAILLVSLLGLTACGYSIPPIGSTPPPDPARPLGQTELSTLDPAGVERILASREARFDVSAGEIEKSVVGLKDSEYAPDVQSRKGSIDIEIIGAAGTLHARSDRLRFFTTDASSTIPYLTYFLVTDTPAEFFALLRADAATYGIDSESVEAWIDSLANDSDGASSFALPEGTALGMTVSYDLRYDEASSAQVVIVQVSPL